MKVGAHIALGVLCAGLALAQASAAPALGTNPLSGQDLLVLATGEKLSGTFLEAGIVLRTAYGAVNLDERGLRALGPAEGSEGLLRVWTVNSNRFTGFPEKTSFGFRVQGQDQREVRWGEVARLTFGAERAAPHDQGQLWVDFKNGDRLSGALLSQEFSLANQTGRVTVAVAELSSLAFQDGTPAMGVAQLKDGRTVQGTLTPAVLRFRASDGPELELYAERVRLLGPAVQPATGFSATAGGTNFKGMVWIPPGEFVMGSPTDELGRDPDEGPQTKVVFTRGFWLGKCEVSQREFQGAMERNPSNASDDPARPVERVTWFEAMDYCEKLNRRAEAEGRLPKGYGYRLPTEAEWEYACRAGSTTRFCYGDDKNDTRLADYAWYTRNGDSTTHPVGQKLANAWGIYDMHGNVWEWCLDRWEGTLPGGTITNAPLAAKGNLRVARGGSWLYDAKACRSANRDDYSPWNRCGDVGFRVVLAPEN